MNSVLTVEQGNPTSHSRKGWEEFTDGVIKKISLENKHIVFIL
jgi:uracil-DNA glycosylase